MRQLLTKLIGGLLSPYRKRKQVIFMYRFMKSKNKMKWVWFSIIYDSD